MINIVLPQFILPRVAPVGRILFMYSRINNQSIKATTQQNETIMPIESTIPWEKGGAADLLSLSGIDYLLTIDYFSRWLEVDRMNDTTTTAIIRVLKEHYARWGNPVHPDQRQRTTVHGSTIPEVYV